MDGSRFDSLARSLAGTSRRGLIGGLATLAAGLAGVGLAEAQACPSGRVARRGQCVCEQTGRPPVGGVCPCPRRQVDRGDGQGCVPDCAGPAEGTPCAPGKVCLDGGCVGNGACAVGIDCGGANPPCADGGCGLASVCAKTAEGGFVCAGFDDAIERCENGACTASAECPPGFACVATCCALNGYPSATICLRVCDAAPSLAAAAEPTGPNPVTGV
jgi:hypothetical protein